MKTIRNIDRLLIIPLLLLASCIVYPEGELPYNEYSQGFVPLQDDTLGGLAEIDTWAIMENEESISLIQYNIVSNELTVISEQTGKVVLYAIGTKDAIYQHVVDIPNLRVLDIDDNGEELLVAMSGQTWKEEEKPREYLNWIAIWDTTLNSMTQCFSESCIAELTDPDRIAIADIGAIMDADTMVVYNEDSYTVTILSPENGGAVSLVNSPDAEYWWNIGKIAIDSENNRLAIVFQEGRIALVKISEPGNWPLAWIDVLEQGEENQLQPIQDVIFDPSSKWLAIVRGEELVIWQVSGWKREVFRERIGNVQGMRFNPSSELLFIGKDDAISVISLEERRVIFEMETPAITSLNISEDNRLLFWGDKDGTIHVWGNQ